MPGKKKEKVVIDSNLEAVREEYRRKLAEVEAELAKLKRDLNAEAFILNYSEKGGIS